jgi:hypothetical protein
MTWPWWLFHTWRIVARTSAAAHTKAGAVASLVRSMSGYEVILHNAAATAQDISVSTSGDSTAAFQPVALPPGARDVISLAGALGAEATHHPVRIAAVVTVVQRGLTLNLTAPGTR